MPRRRREAQASLFFINNQNLFSNNYLIHKLNGTSIWADNIDAAAEAFERIKNHYREIQELNLGVGEERSLEEHFIGPVLKALGFSYDVQPITRRGRKKKRPDYALFKDEDSFKDAREHKDQYKRFFSSVISILEAKYWGRRLNDTDVHDELDPRDPTAQTIKYLEDVHYNSGGKINWAILTNGKLWRMFYYGASSYSSYFYEVDLEEIIQRDDINAFLYFFLFFSKAAFIPDLSTGKTFLDQHLAGSEAYAEAVSEHLKDLIFDRVFEDLAAGFIQYRKSDLGIIEETQATKKEIFKGCLTLLYRLLFLLYAESRNLLPVEEEKTYYQKSLKKLKEDVSDVYTTIGIDNLSLRAADYWQRLVTLFDIINRGDPALNVPIYNGGLFFTPQGSFLETNKLPDKYLAQAIWLLTVEKPFEVASEGMRFIDYSSLDVRRLGDIYEGLLEFEIQIAKKSMALVNEKGKLIWKPARSVSESQVQKIVAAGDVYIENSKHERRASGSYYTPHYVVDYIVKNAVGPVMDEQFTQAAKLFDKYSQLPTGDVAKDEKRRLSGEIFDCIFCIKVLDPAMGSGHFLVHTVDYISDRIITFLARFPDNPIINRIYAMQEEILDGLHKQGIRIDDHRILEKLTEINLIKRMVMKRCIYGVDLNEMAVELAKLSLWLHFFTLGAPLSFLDHHLKNGNSLIGVNIKDLEAALEGQLFAIDLDSIKKSLANMVLVADLPDATFQQVRESYEKYCEASAGLEGYRIFLDLLVARYFGIAHAEELLTLAMDRIDPSNLKRSIEKLHSKERKAIEKVEAIVHERKFFHWELEFPEVFYEQVENKVIKRRNPGFACIIGNPPYDVLSELEQGRSVDDEKSFYSSMQRYIPAIGSKLNLYRLFCALSFDLLQYGGSNSFIVPMALLGDKQAHPLREFIIKKQRLRQVEAFPQKDDPTDRVFQEAKLSTCIYVADKADPGIFHMRIHPGKDILESSTILHIEPSQIVEFDSENLSIPSYPTMTEYDFELALKIKRVSHGSTLSDFAQSQQGEVNLTAHKGYFTDESGQVVLRGAHINRYEFQEEPKQGEPVYLNVEKFLVAHGPKTKAYDHNFTRIGYQRGAAIDNWRRIIATIVDHGNFCSDTVNYIVRPKKISLLAVLALLNSSLWEWRFRLTSTNNHVNSYEIDSMPMPPLVFSDMHAKDRSRNRERMLAFVESNDNENLLQNVDKYIERGESQCITDVLARLALNIIQMTKKKKVEVKGFLKWLERELGCGIDDLQGKSTIKGYYQLAFDALLNTLKRNESKVKRDLSSRKFQEALENNFNESVDIIRPLTERIMQFDELIDKIIFRLYQMTSKEVDLVISPR